MILSASLRSRIEDGEFTVLSGTIEDDLLFSRKEAAIEIFPLGETLYLIIRIFELSFVNECK